MSYTSPMIEYDGQSTASKSNTIELGKPKIVDDFPEIAAKGGQRKSVLVTQFQESEETQEWPKFEEINKDRSQTHKNSPKKFKTELCKNWELTGKCNYRVKCQFAHGKQELLLNPELVLNEKYKSKNCKQYHQQQFCPYGSRCLFVHELRDQENILSETFYQKMLSNLGELEPSQESIRLPILQQLTADRYCFSKIFPNPIGILLPKKI